MHQPVSLLPSFRNIRHLQYVNFVLQAMNAAKVAMDTCVQTLLPIVVAPEVHQNDSYVCELTYFDLLHARIYHGGWLHRGPQRKNKKHRAVKIGEWALARRIHSSTHLQQVR